LLGDVEIGRSRKRLNPGREQDPIRTVRGIGYALDAGITTRACAFVTPCTRAQLRSRQGRQRNLSAELERFYRVGFGCCRRRSAAG
jgi:DNA-binding winged helix-turn-helix (wHTH) protein